eukprot:4274592-Pyramimonas_sp.AAC.1
MVALTLLAFTKALFYLPSNALAAIVLSAVSGLFDYTEATFLWKVSKKGQRRLLRAQAIKGTEIARVSGYRRRLGCG